MLVIESCGETKKYGKAQCSGKKQSQLSRDFSCFSTSNHPMDVIACLDPILTMFSRRCFSEIKYHKRNCRFALRTRENSLLPYGLTQHDLSKPQL